MDLQIRSRQAASTITDKYGLPEFRYKAIVNDIAAAMRDHASPLHERIAALEQSLADKTYESAGRLKELTRAAEERRTEWTRAENAKAELERFCPKCSFVMGTGITQDGCMGCENLKLKAELAAVREKLADAMQFVPRPETMSGYGDDDAPDDVRDAERLIREVEGRVRSES